jgi:hypothetical protein
VRQSPYFSVILPTRGNSAHLGAAIRSALSNKVALEVVIAHDRRPGEGPLDADLLGDDRVCSVESSRPGLPAARNAAIDVAQGRFLSLLDDDDLWSSDHLANALEVLDRHPTAVLVASASCEFVDRTLNGSGTPVADWQKGPRLRPELDAGLLARSQLLLGNCFVAPAVTLVRERLGAERFDEKLEALEDYEMWLRLSLRHPLLFDPRPSVLVRRRVGSMSTDLRRMAASEIEVLQRQLAVGNDHTEVHPDLLDRRFGRLHHELAYACLLEGDLPGAKRALAASERHTPGYWKNRLYRLAVASPGLVGRLVLWRGRRLWRRNQGRRGSARGLR